jgi:hypothetical protein
MQQALMHQHFKKNKNCSRYVTVTVTRRSALPPPPPCPTAPGLKRSRRFCVGLSDPAYTDVSKKHIGWVDVNVKH